MVDLSTVVEGDLPAQRQLSWTDQENLRGDLVASHYALGPFRSDDDEVTPSRRTRLLADLALAAAVLLGGVSVFGGLASELGGSELLEGFVISNTVIGLSFVVAGYPISRLKPANAVGWLLIGAGLAYAVSGAGYAALAWGTSPGENGPGWRLLADVTALGWPAAIGFFIPMALLAFPTGVLPSVRWRWLVVLDLIALVVFETSMVLGPRDTTTDLGVAGYLRWTALDGVGWIGPATGLLGLAVYGLCLASLVMRYVRGSEQERRQLLWFLSAVLLMLTGFLASDVFGIESWAFIFAIALPPLAVVVAILRHQLLDIRLVLSRSVAYLVLSGMVVAAYLLLVTLTSGAATRNATLGPQVLAALAIAVAFNPVRLRVQGGVDRVLYGARNDPVRAVAELGASLGALESTDAEGLSDVLESLCRVLRFPWASLVIDAEAAAAYGEPLGEHHCLPLRLGAVEVGELWIGLRRGEKRLDPEDMRVLALLSGSLSIALQAVRFAEELRQARTSLVSAREEERRRLRRDLHDGLGPLLTGVILKAGAARRLTSTDSAAAADLLDELRRETTGAVEEIRRLVNELRPPELDVLGLLGAIDQRATQLRARTDGSPLHVRVDTTHALPLLSASVEVALYRIALEALNNVARHSSASMARVTLVADLTHLVLTVVDDGTRVATPLTPGVGLTSMAERAAELGGSVEVRADHDGWVVSASVPIGVAP